MKVAKLFIPFILLLCFICLQVVAAGLGAIGTDTQSKKERTKRLVYCFENLCVIESEGKRVFLPECESCLSLKKDSPISTHTSSDYASNWEANFNETNFDHYPNLKLDIFDIHGDCVKSLLWNQIDGLSIAAKEEELEAGIYLYQFTTEESLLESGKIIIQ